MAEMPDYVKNFQRPPHTEIKHIKNGWYLYERFSRYDPVKKRSMKISGKLLGTFKPTGFVLSEYGLKKAATSRTEISEGREVEFLMEITGEMREALKKIFPENWVVIYTLALLQALHAGEGRFTSIKEQYQNSRLSQIYPDLVVDDKSLSGFLEFLGLQRGRLIQVFRELAGKPEECLLVEGTGESKVLALVKKDPYGPGIPLYYMRYENSRQEGIGELLYEAGDLFPKVILVGERAGEEIPYVTALDRGNPEIQGRIPEELVGFGPYIFYNEKTLAWKRVPIGDHSAYFYLDYRLLSDEMSVLALNRERGLKPDTPDLETGTFILASSLPERSGMEMFGIFRQGMLFRQFAAVFDLPSALSRCCNEEDQEDDQEDYQEEGLLFINHLSLVIRALALEKMASSDESFVSLAREILGAGKGMVLAPVFPGGLNPAVAEALAENPEELCRWMGMREA